MSLNKVMLIGNLGADPELRYTPNQMAVCSLRIATNEKRKGADGQWTDHTEWHSVTVWGKQAENCNQYLQKGKQVYVEGRLQTRKWQDQEGKDRYKTDIIANSVQFLSAGRGGDGMSVEKTFSSDDAQGNSFMANRAASPSTSADAGDAISFDDDDIPF